MFLQAARTPWADGGLMAAPLVAICCSDFDQHLLLLLLCLQERTNAPAVFLNPIMNKIPGNILGPDDVPN
jgi:hypothetical protein